MKRREDIEYANELLPDYAGFILAKGRRRTVSPMQMEELAAHLDARVQRVGVFVDQSIDWIADLARNDLIDVIQLHGHETQEDIRQLKRVTDKTIVKAFRVTGAEICREAEASEADLVLLDAGTGDGKTFDWTFISGIRRKFFLAGGLSPDNVSEAVAQVHPWAVDVSSGVETDGDKDFEKMKAFVRAVRQNT